MQCRRLIKFFCTTAALAAVTLSGVTANADNRTALGVRDLYYGETLFHFYQQDHFTALTHLLAARAARRVPNHAEDSELLLGGLYLNYGQHRQAADIFERLLKSHDDAAVRSQAWFYLGKVRYQRGLAREALEAFARADTQLPAELEAERHMLTAQSHLALEEFDEAARVLDQWQGPAHWMAFARYNLGVALVRMDRFEQGVLQLDAVGQLQSGDAEILSLRDKANVALGYSFLQKEQPGEARNALQRVRLSGPYSGKALLGAGWADVARAEYRDALTPWLELKGRDLLDSAVQESLLAIPYAFAQLGAHGSAVEHYQAALETYGTEITRLDGAISRARQGTLVPALLDIDNAAVSHWNWQLEDVPESTDSRYLFELIADHDFHEGLRNTRDLLALQNYLDEWRGKLSVFVDIIDTRATAYNRRLPVVGARLNDIDLPQLQARREALALRLATIARTRDIMGLASIDEISAWTQLNALESNLAFNHPEATDARRKHRVLKGFVLWNADRDYKLRLYEQRRGLASIDTALAGSALRQKGAQLAQLSDPAIRQQYRDRIAGLDQRLSRLQQQIAATLRAQTGSLGQLAAQELERRKERLAAYQLQARFSLATALDRATASRSDGRAGK